MAAAAPFVPMIVGAGAGAMIDRQNPLRGAMLGAVGGTVFPGTSAAVSGLLAGADPAVAAAYGATGALGGAEQAAALAAQTGSYGTEGLLHTLGSAGVSPDKAALLAEKATSFPGMIGMPSKAAIGKTLQGFAGMGKQEQQPTVKQAPPPQMPSMPIVASTSRMSQRNPRSRLVELQGIWG